MSEAAPATSPVGSTAGRTYRVLIDGRVVAGVSRVSPLRRVTETIEFYEGSKPGAIRRLPGVTNYDAIRLERVASLDEEFEEWASRVCFFGREPEEPDPNFRKDLLIEALDEAGEVAVSYHVYRCWPSEYVSISPTDGGQAIETITLQHEGWERVGADTEARRAARAARQQEAQAYLVSTNGYSITAAPDAPGAAGGAPVEVDGLNQTPADGDATVAAPTAPSAAA
jgi:phage tail-like protein